MNKPAELARRAGARPRALHRATSARRSSIPSTGVADSLRPDPHQPLGHARPRLRAHSRAPGTYRIALLGASTVMGWGVGDDEAFEALVERRLNEAPARAGFYPVRDPQLRRARLRAPAAAGGAGQGLGVRAARHPLRRRPDASCWARSRTWRRPIDQGRPHSVPVSARRSRGGRASTSRPTRRPRSGASSRSGGEIISWLYGRDGTRRAVRTARYLSSCSSRTSTRVSGSRRPPRCSSAAQSRGLRRARPVRASTAASTRHRPPARRVGRPPERARPSDHRRAASTSAIVAERRDQLIVSPEASRNEITSSDQRSRSSSSRSSSPGRIPAS